MNIIEDVKKNEDINAENIMNHIRENIEKRDAIKIDTNSNTKKTDIEQYIDYMNSNWNLYTDYNISSHRPIIGRLLTWGRQLIHGEVRRYVDPITRKQTEFNSCIAKLFNGYFDYIDRKINDVTTSINNDIDRKIKDVTTSINNDIDRKIKDVTNNKLKGLYSSDKVMNYFLFEEKYRGSTEDIKQRQSIFLPYFKNCKNVLDIGCGRGEFLSLLKDNDIGAKGIDINEDMVLLCKKNDLDVDNIDALSYLGSLKDKSLDGTFSGQLIEHLQPNELISLIKLCYDKMIYGTYLIAETINPSCIYASRFFYMDMSHVRYVHPDTMRFLMESVGFRDVEIKFLSPCPDYIKLGMLKIDDDLDDKNRQQLQLMNQNFEKLNDLLFGYQDYAIIGRK